ncbi:hypothetical protein BC826DRAFT_1006822 [Russula brevipes]|nr:hypothetical protein BC826DRAFT_1006822 [Russula brevipes]
MLHLPMECLFGIAGGQLMLPSVLPVLPCSVPAQLRTYSTGIPKWCVSTWYARQQTTPHGGASSALTLSASITLCREHYHTLQNSFQITCVIPTESVQGHKVRKHVRKYIPKGRNEWEPGTKK